MQDNLGRKAEECPCESPTCVQSEPLTGSQPTVHRNCINVTGTQKSLHTGFLHKLWMNTQRNRRRILLGTVGLLMIMAAITIYAIDPLERAIVWQTSVIEGTMAFEMWRKPTVSVHVNVHVFNVTNPVEFLEGREKLRVQDLGPYVYREQLENMNTTFNENGTVTFWPRRELFLERELSSGDPAKDRITFPNVPFLGAASMLHSSSVFTNLGLRSLTSYLNSQPFINMTVEDLLLGYDDPLMRVAHTVLPSLLGFSRFGILDRMYAHPNGGEVVTMKAGYNAGLDPNVPDPWVNDVFSLDTYDGSPGLEKWGYGETLVRNPDTNEMEPEELPCNTVRGSFEGFMFPRGLSPEKKFYVYRRAFCRTFPSVYDHDGIGPGGFRALWFKLDKFALDPQDEQNSCFCKSEREECLPLGLTDVSPCYSGLPLALSKPHFLQGDTKLITSINGLQPNEEEHDSQLVVQPELGIPLTIRCKIQMNLVVKKTKMQPKVAPFDNLIIPIAWIDFSVKDLPSDIQMQMTLVLYVGPKVQIGLIVLLALIGIIIVLRALIQFRRDKQFYSSVVIEPPCNDTCVEVADN